MMTIELRMLALSILLGFVHIILGAHAATRQYGLDWNLGPRDETQPPLEATAGRLQRASRNFAETFVLFAAAVLAAQIAGRNGTLTHLGVQLYFWGRVAYLPLYAYGVTFVRTVAWGVSVLGIGLILLALI
jgi:uncharacterized MAPEG superfamily protein